VAKAADGLCNVWQKTHFNILTQDLWEESYTFPDIETTHTYSLAACAHGLELASRMIPSIRWLSVAKEMRQKIASSFHGYFYRCDGKLHDKRVDASLLGLVWPFRIYAADNSRMKATVAQIEKKLLRPEGVYRYEMDSYGGYRRQGIDTYRGAGAWPVNSFWLSIYYSLAGKKSRARKLFGSMLAHDKYFPEQFFDNKVQVSVKPLAWSHAMFVLAARELGLL
jgi:GH15 family glucan-1,4-alpha-glucosidase